MCVRETEDRVIRLSGGRLFSLIQGFGVITAAEGFGYPVEIVGNPRLFGGALLLEPLILLSCGIIRLFVGICLRRGVGRIFGRLCFGVRLAVLLIVRQVGGAIIVVPVVIVRWAVERRPRIVVPVVKRGVIGIVRIRSKEEKRAESMLIEVSKSASLMKCRDLSLSKHLNLCPLSSACPCPKLLPACRPKSLPKERP